MDFSENLKPKSAETLNENKNSSNYSQKHEINNLNVDKKQLDYLSINEYGEIIKVCLDLELYEEGYSYMLNLINLRSYNLKEEERNYLMRLAKEKLNMLAERMEESCRL
jgi:hypothetical protein